MVLIVVAVVVMIISDLGLVSRVSVFPDEANHFASSRSLLTTINRSNPKL